jgi:hydrogenase maturation protease
VILVDAAARGRPPGTLSVLDAAGDDLGAATLDTHGMDPVRVLRLARTLGRVPARVLVVACEPETLPDADEVIAGLSRPVRAAVDAALPLIASLVQEAVPEEETPCRPRAGT